MKIPRVVGLLICLAILATAQTAFSQEADAGREKTRERLSALLTRVGPDLSVEFKPSSKSPYVFTGLLRDGLKNAEYFEIVISVTTKETIALGYLAVIQLLPPRQRAIFLLREVLGWSAAETASLLRLSVAATNSALQRARQTIERQASLTPSDAVRAPTEDERTVLQAFIDAHQGTDPRASLALLCEDVRVTMPPHPLCYEGVARLAPLIAGAAQMGEWRLVAAWANRQPAAVSYLRRPNDREFRAFKIDVLRIRDRRIQEITTFEGRLVELFGLPAILP